MRRFLFGMAIASITVAAPMTALAGDREIADAIVSNLKQKQANGSLKGFDIDLSVEGGKVTFTGKVANKDTRAVRPRTPRAHVEDSLI